MQECLFLSFFFKQKTAYEMRISDWSSDVCSSDLEVVRTLDIGADDYVVKPFSVEQLEARIRAVLRRAGTVVDEPVRVGELSIDVASRTAVLAGEELELAPKEFDLLAYLAEREGQVISKRELLGEIWHQPYGGSDKSIDVHLS